MTTSANMSTHIALVTGASAGIGQATAERLLDRGTKVICVARNLERLKACFGDRGDNVFILPLDVTDGAAVAGLLDQLPPAWRDIDILVANAGSDVGGRKRFDEGDVEDWASTVEINVTGVIRACHVVIHGMLQRGRGHIVILGSIAGLRTYPGGNIYAATKYAVRAFTDGLRRDYANDPLRITEILPGLVRTEFAEARFRGDQGRAEDYYASFPAYLAPGDIAESIMFALDQPAHVNIGQIVIAPTGDK